MGIRAISYSQDCFDHGSKVSLVKINLNKRNLTLKNTNMQTLELPSTKNYHPMLAVSDGSAMRLLQTNDIMYACADGSYSRVHLRDGTSILVSRNLKSIGNKLPSPYFVRVHHSCIVNILHATHFHNGGCSTLTMSNGEEVPVSRSRKNVLMDRYERL